MKIRQKAFGLMEVIVAIAISGVVIISAISVAAHSLRTVKQNEMKDIASGILLRSLEIARSPVSYDLNSKVSAAFSDNYFRLRPDPNNDNAYDLFLVTDSAVISTCAASSNYIVTDLAAQNILICNQIVVKALSPDRTLVSGSKVRTFEVKSIVVYTFLSQPFKEELISYRSELVS